MDWLLISTGFTGALTLVYLVRAAYRWWAPPLSLSVFHSPKGGCTDAVVREIQAARCEVLVQAYSFTSKPIADALIAAKGRGCNIEILLDKSNECKLTASQVAGARAHTEQIYDTKKPESGDPREKQKGGPGIGGM